jgi:hypothetical protein
VATGRRDEPGGAVPAVPSLPLLSLSLSLLPLLGLSLSLKGEASLTGREERREAGVGGRARGAGGSRC